MTKTWSMTNVEQGARTVDKIVACAHKKTKDVTKFNCNEEPVFLSVPVHRVVQDTLHPCLRICDEMVSHLVAFLLKMDNVSKSSVTAKKLENAKNKEIAHDGSFSARSEPSILGSNPK